MRMGRTYQLAITESKGEVGVEVGAEVARPLLVSVLVQASALVVLMLVQIQVQVVFAQASTPMLVLKRVIKHPEAAITKNEAQGRMIVQTWACLTPHIDHQTGLGVIGNVERYLGVTLKEGVKVTLMEVVAEATTNG